VRFEVRLSFCSQFCYQLVGKACRLGQAIFGCAGEDDFDCIFQQAFVAHRDKNRFDVGAGPDYSADNLIVVGEQAIRALFAVGFFEGAG
jgi:hypothetical protein